MSNEIIIILLVIWPTTLWIAFIIGRMVEDRINTRMWRKWQEEKRGQGRE